MRNSASFGNGVPFVAWMLLWLLGGVVALVSLADEF